MQNWIDINKQKPREGQNCLVVFQSGSGDDASRYMLIDQFDHITSFEEFIEAVRCGISSDYSKIKAICWAPTDLTNDPVDFDEFWDEVAA